MRTALLYIFVSTAALAATNQVVITTNYVTAAPEFRKVGGTLYNADKSERFVLILGTCNGSREGCVFVYPFESYKQSPDSLVRSGNFLGSAPPSKTAQKTQSIEYRQCAITNYPKSAHIGDSISEKALPIGTVLFNGDPVPLYDHGLPNIVAVVKTNIIKAPEPSGPKTHD